MLKTESSAQAAPDSADPVRSTSVDPALIPGHLPGHRGYRHRLDPFRVFM
jgi:hypothetical protein